VGHFLNVVPGPFSSVSYIADEEARKAEKEVMKAALVRPERRSSYDYCNAPASAYYNQNSKGAFGSRYVGD
ncbi:hypothetical protein DXB48_18835, partial [Bacteroides uniformis]